MINSLKQSGIIGTGRYLPEHIMTNQDLEKIVDTTDEWIVTRSGIHERRVADANTATSDMSTKAAILALEDAGITADQVDLIIVATLTPDMLIPSTACIVQSNIGAVNAAAFDLEAACTGFIYGLTIADSFIKTGMYKNILVIGAETLTKYLDYRDRGTCVLFGDGAGAAVVSEVPSEYGIISNYMGADGTNGMALSIPGGGSRTPASQMMLEESQQFIKMDGSVVFRFATKIMSEAAEKVLQLAGIEKEDLDFMIPHQANIRIIDAAIKKLKVPKEKVYVNLNKYGNMSAASIPVALDEAKRNGLLKNGDNLLLVGFGAGLTWGASVMKWYDSRRNANV